MNDYYEILEVNQNASQEQIKAQYHFLVQAWHPDKFVSAHHKAKAEEKLKGINEAFNVLNNPQKREQFDRLKNNFRNNENLQRRAEQEARESAARQAYKKGEAVEHERNATMEREQRQADERQKRTVTIDLAPGIPFEFIRISAGEFLMGSDQQKEKQARANETPQHKVFLSEYWIGKYPVTNKQYKVFVKAVGHKPPANWGGFDAPKDKFDHPVAGLSWFSAMAFCEWFKGLSTRNIRLPSEAEWEKAARGTDGRSYPWGNQAPDDTRCNYKGNVKDTTPVGKYSPLGDSPYGCSDMEGNVWEWVMDWYGDNYYQDSSFRNPPGPAMGTYKVLRGSSWYYSDKIVRSADRDGSSPTNELDVIGFRCACSP